MSTSRTSSRSIDHQIGTLLAFIILFEKKIEELRIRLAGNEQFHSRLAFQLLDNKRKCAISHEDFYNLLNRFSSSKQLASVEAFCRKYTANGAFSYDEFIKFLTPKTNKLLAQRLMIRTYRKGAQLPGYVISLLFQLLQQAISMMSVTENLRKQIQQNNQLTHMEIVQLFKKCCTSREKLFYFINASTDGEGDYDFTLDEMKYLTHHVKGSCELDDIQDHQIKEILYPIDMNYQKNLYGGTMGNGLNLQAKNRTDYFKTKSSLNVKGSEVNDENNRATVNFLKTNYRQTSKNFFNNTAKQKQKTEPRDLCTELDQNVQTKLPIPMNYTKNFPNSQDQSIRNPIFQSKGLNLPQRLSQQPGDVSQISQMINYGNLYIQKFARGPNDYSGIGGSRSNHNQASTVRELDNFLFEKYEMKKKKEIFEDDFRRNKQIENSGDMSVDSAFVQY